MSVLLGRLSSAYHFLNEEIADPKTNNWFLISSPWPGLAILFAYIVFTFRLLPEHMKNRPAYDMRLILKLYNAFQIVACAYVLVKSLTLGWMNHYSLFCQLVEDGPAGVEYAWHVSYAYFGLKMLDMLDTVFFVLRQKKSHLSFLHVYHHIGMILVSWMIVKWVPGGHITLIIPINSFVHMLMYSYYLLTATYPNSSSFWWKKHITQIQIIQFVIVLTNLITLVISNDCAYPRVPAYILIPHNVFIMVLFSDFYYRTYIKAKKE